MDIVAEGIHVNNGRRYMTLRDLGKVKVPWRYNRPIGLEQDATRPVSSFKEGDTIMVQYKVVQGVKVLTSALPAT